MAPNPDRFGSYIRRRRLSKSLILRDLALSTKLDSSRISQLERHATRKPPSDQEVETLAITLEIDRKELQRIAEDYAPDLTAVRDDENPIQNAVFLCRTEE